MYSLYNIVICIGTIEILVSFLIAYKLRNKIENSTFLSKFWICPFIAFLISTNTIIHEFFIHYNNSIHYSFQNILFILDLFFWAFYFLNLSNDKNYNTKIKVFLVLTLILYSLTLFANDSSKPNLHFFSTINICKSLFCLLYYSELFKNIPDKNITKEPSFWIVTGLIFYSCISIPFYTLHVYIKELFPFNISLNIFAISNVLIIMMHLFFLKAYLCIIRQHKE